MFALPNRQIYSNIYSLNIKFAKTELYYCQELYHFMD